MAPSKPIPTKTTNKIHFDDLDSHRFEDLCMELLKGLYSWKYLDPIGGLGNDNGVDIFGIDKEGCEYYIQAKRYQKITPKEVENIVRKIACENNVAKNAIVILMLACDISCEGYKVFRRVSEECGFKDAEIFTAKKIEAELYTNRMDLLEKYFGVCHSNSKVSHRATIKNILAIRKKLEKILYRSELSNIPPHKIAADPKIVFWSDEAMILSPKAATSPNRYSNIKEDGIWMKVFPHQITNFGLECDISLFSRIAFNRMNDSWRVLNIDYSSLDLSKDDVVIACIHRATLPFSVIIDVEDSDNQVNFPVIYCAKDDIYESLQEHHYVGLDTYDGIDFAVNRPVESCHLTLLKEILRNTKS